MFDLDALHTNFESFDAARKEMESLFEAIHALGGVRYPYYKVIVQTKGDCWGFDSPKVLKGNEIKIHYPDKTNMSGHEAIRCASVEIQTQARIPVLVETISNSLCNILSAITHSIVLDDISGETAEPWPDSVIEMEVLIEKNSKICMARGESVQSIYINAHHCGLTLDDSQAVFDLFALIRYAQDKALEKPTQSWVVRCQGNHLDDDVEKTNDPSIRVSIQANTEQDVILLVAAKGYNFMLSPQRVMDLSVLKKNQVNPWQNGVFDLDDISGKGIVPKDF